MNINKAVLIGFGHHGRYQLFDSLKDISSIKKILIYDFSKEVFNDFNPASAKNYKDFKIELTTDWDEVVAFIDKNTFAVISTSAESHYHYFMNLANLNVKKIYIEKPMCQSLEQAKEIKEMAHKKNIKVAVGFYNQYFEIVKNFQLYQDKYDLGNLYKIISQGGNNDLSAIGIHMIDLANYLFKSIPVKVFGHISGRTMNPRGSQYFNFGGLANFIYPQEKELLLSYHHLSNVTCSLELLFKFGIIKYHVHDGYIEIFSVEDKQKSRPLYRHQRARLLDKIIAQNNWANFFTQIFENLINDGEYPNLSRSIDSIQGLLGIFVSDDLGSIVNLPIGEDNEYFRRKYPIT